MFSNISILDNKEKSLEDWKKSSLFLEVQLNVCVSFWIHIYVIY